MKPFILTVCIFNFLEVNAQQWSDRGGDFQPTVPNIFGFVPLILGLIVGLILIKNKIYLNKEKNKDKLWAKIIRKNEFLTLQGYCTINSKIINNPTISIVDELLVVSSEEDAHTTRITGFSAFAKFDLKTDDNSNETPQCSFIIDMPPNKPIDFPFKLTEQELEKYYKLGVSLIKTIRFGEFGYLPLKRLEEKYSSLKNIIQYYADK